jgi:hypothetical protein
MKTFTKTHSFGKELTESISPSNPQLSYFTVRKRDEDDYPETFNYTERYISAFDRGNYDPSQDGDCAAVVLQNTFGVNMPWIRIPCNTRFDHAIFVCEIGVQVARVLEPYIVFQVQSSPLILRLDDNHMIEFDADQYFCPRHWMLVDGHCIRFLSSGWATHTSCSAIGADLLAYNIALNVSTKGLLSSFMPVFGESFLTAGNSSDLCHRMRDTKSSLANFV